ncbi:dienelactone hydrolase family protein [Sutcliffiella rhizosphaerae]|uniref:Dienelactone hydrolase n=1 Tax=Sutcliffiella rhizosphaerae TaxID=2880967 RepID=A0ABM8YLT2_9BACI|nr:alpha/beta hydrolase family protein [Sutcliffiella rhizosphaerae]CAG9620950.1 hypothetical protein BACCIP111883_01722 [Sutcliffiella rhizosphaerae]
MWNPDKFLDNLYGEKLTSHTKTYNPKWKEKLLEEFKELLGNFSIHPQVEKPRILEVREEEGYTRIRMTMETYPDLWMPFYLLIPIIDRNKPFPVVLALHGHGYGSKEIVGLNPDGSETEEDGIHKNFAVALVKRGVIVAAPELIGFGDRRTSKVTADEPPIANSCFQLASSLLLMGKTLPGLRVFECRRMLDYLSTREDIDITKIGCMGLSGGGLVSAFTSIVDQRIIATVISGYTNTFKGSIMDRNHCLDNYVPSILKHAEMPELIGLIAPRALFIESGYKDQVFPIQEAQTAVQTLTEIYHAFNSKMEAHYFNGGHEICGEKSYDWLLTQLQQ